MKQIGGRDLISALKRRGWTVARIHGSHHILVHMDNPARISVPVHANRPLKTGLVRHLMKLADLSEQEL